MQQDQLGKSFGLIIAFLIPGMVGLYAVSIYVPVIREWFGIAVDQSTTIGGFLFVIVASIGMGVFISGMRWFVLEHLIWKRESPELNTAQRPLPHSSRPPLHTFNCPHEHTTGS